METRTSGCAIGPLRSVNGKPVCRCGGACRGACIRPLMAHPVSSSLLNNPSLRALNSMAHVMTGSVMRAFMSCVARKKN
eukprot:7808719-Pyramimonas_sp.AAC.1